MGGLLRRVARWPAWAKVVAIVLLSAGAGLVSDALPAPPRLTAAQAVQPAPATVPSPTAELVTPAPGPASTPVSDPASAPMPTRPPTPTPVPPLPPVPPPPPAPCSGLTLSASPASPQPPGTTVTFTAAVAGCSGPTVDFWITDPTGVGVLVQGPGAQTTWVWATAFGTAAGTWTITAHAQGPAGTPPAAGSIQYTLSSPPPPMPCTNLTVSASPDSPQPLGTSVLFQGAVASCSSPIYRFWLTDTNGVGTLLQDWSSSATYTWATTPDMQAGTYTIRVEARDATDANVEQSLDVTYSLT